MAAHGRMSQGLCPRLAACATSYGCQTSRFFSREAEENVYVVGFVDKGLIYTDLKWEAWHA